MKNSTTTIVSVVAAGFLLAAGGFYLGRSTSGSSNSSMAPAGAASQADGRKVLYWHDPMVPGQRFEKPGKSPFMDMQLVPVYADSDPADGGVKVSPTVQQNLGIRYATVQRKDVSSSFDTIGAVQFDERLTVTVQTRVGGYVERLSARAPMERVRQGQALATVFAPEWLAPQNELLALQRAGVSADIVSAARERMRAMSIPESLIWESEQKGVAQARYVISAPIGGVIAELGIREGAAVKPGMTLFRIAGLQRVWAVADVPEPQAVRLRAGQRVKASLQADPSQTFEGALKEIIPEVNANTRTLKARFEVDNRSGSLTPGMLLRLAVSGPTASQIVVPSEAVIRTGKRAVVIVRKDSGAFEPRDVSAGEERGDEVVVVEGLSEGEQVVASGQFLVDSEARLRTVLTGMTPTAEALPASASASAFAPGRSATHLAEGNVESVTADAITISHGPVTSMKWPAMTMGFGKPAGKAFPAVKPGDRIRFEFKEGGPAGFELQSLQVIASGAKQ